MYLTLDFCVRIIYACIYLSICILYRIGALGIAIYIYKLPIFTEALALIASNTIIVLASNARIFLSSQS
jgi:hypothetical protein